jgi:hypothetical protein
VAEGGLLEDAYQALVAVGLSPARAIGSTGRCRRRKYASVEEMLQEIFQK